MNCLFVRLLLIFLAIFNFSYCSQPVGDLSSSSLNNDVSGGGGASGFWIFAEKKEYYLSEQSTRIFQRNSDHLKIIGEYVDLNDNSLKIEIMTDPLFIGSPVYVVINPRGSFEFTLPGNYILKGTYKGMTDESKFDVLGNPPQTGEGSAGVDMIWLP